MIQINYGNFYEFEKDLKNGSFNIIVLDFPWGILKRDNNHTDVQWDTRPSIEALGVIADRLLDRFGYVIVFGDRNLIKVIEKEWQHIFTLRDEIAWVKPLGMPSHFLKPIPVFELILILRKCGTKVSDGAWNPRVIPGKPYLKKGRAGAVSTRRQLKGSTHRNETGMRHLQSVIHAPNKPAMRTWERDGMLHPTMKSVQLMLQLVKAYSNPGARVLDGFSGSASTAIACFLSGRHSKSYENDSMWFQQSVMRFNRLREMLGPGQVSQLLDQADEGVDEFDQSALYP
ncbi:site-specific DNA-methyltransferase [bacterium]|nr:site-specific DNA-methyltransferase [bacterium]